MELLRKFLDLLNQLFNRFAQKQDEKKEIKQTEITQKIKTEKKLSERKPIEVKPPRKDDFFSDDDGGW